MADNTIDCIRCVIIILLLSQSPHAEFNKFMCTYTESELIYIYNIYTHRSMLVQTLFVDLETIEQMGTKFRTHISGEDSGSVNSFVFQSIYVATKY